MLLMHHEHFVVTKRISGSNGFQLQHARRVTIQSQLGFRLPRCCSCLRQLYCVEFTS